LRLEADVRPCEVHTLAFARELVAGNLETMGGEAIRRRGGNAQTAPRAMHEDDRRRVSGGAPLFCAWRQQPRAGQRQAQAEDRSPHDCNRAFKAPGTGDFLTRSAPMIARAEDGESRNVVQVKTRAEKARGPQLVVHGNEEEHEQRAEHHDDRAVACATSAVVRPAASVAIAPSAAVPICIVSVNAIVGSAS